MSVVRAPIFRNIALKIERLLAIGESGLQLLREKILPPNFRKGVLSWNEKQTQGICVNLKITKISFVDSSEKTN